VADIIPPSPVNSAIKEDGSMFQRFRDWTQSITRAVNLSTVATGSGTPENNLEAFTNKLYIDTAGPSIYWKSVDDISGDKSQGWIITV
jgi:hypothetical protein